MISLTLRAFMYRSVLQPMRSSANLFLREYAEYGKTIRSILSLPWPLIKDCWRLIWAIAWLGEIAGSMRDYEYCTFQWLMPNLQKQGLDRILQRKIMIFVQVLELRTEKILYRDLYGVRVPKPALGKSVYSGQYLCLVLHVRHYRRNV